MGHSGDIAVGSLTDLRISTSHSAKPPRECGMGCGGPPKMMKNLTSRERSAAVTEPRPRGSGCWGTSVFQQSGCTSTISPDRLSTRRDFRLLCPRADYFRLRTLAGNSPIQRSELNAPSGTPFTAPAALELLHRRGKHRIWPSRDCDRRQDRDPLQFGYPPLCGHPAPIETQREIDNSARPGGAIVCRLMAGNGPARGSGTITVFRRPFSDPTRPADY